MSDRNKLLTILSVFAALFLISLVIFIVKADDIKQRVIFFPEDKSDNLIGEVRKLKSRGNLEKDIESLLKEILLGPEQLKNSRYIPLDTIVNSVILRDGILYADYSDGIINSRLLFKSPETQISEEAGDKNPETAEAEKGSAYEPAKQTESKIISLKKVLLT